MTNDREKKTWTLQGIPENVSGSKPRPDKELAPSH